MRSVACVAGAGVAFGTVSVLAKGAYGVGAAPSSLFGVRLVVCAAVLGAVAALAGSRPGCRELRLGVPAGVALAGVGFLEFQALARLQATAVVVLVFVAPIWVALAGWLLSGTAPGRARSAMVALILAGIATLMGAGDSGPIEVRGAALALGASLLAAAFFMALERCAAEMRGAVRTAAAVALGAAAVGLVVEPLGLARALAAQETAPYGLAIGILTAGGVVLLVAGIRVTAALSASAIIGIEPLAGALLAWLFLGEVLTTAQLAGAAAVLAGVTGMCVLSAREPRAAAAVTGR